MEFNCLNFNPPIKYSPSVLYDTGSKLKYIHLKGLTVYNTVLLMTASEIYVIDYNTKDSAANPVNSTAKKEEKDTKMTFFLPK